MSVVVYQHCPLAFTVCRVHVTVTFLCNMQNMVDKCLESGN